MIGSKVFDKWVWAVHETKVQKHVVIQLCQFIIEKLKMRILVT